MRHDWQLGQNWTWDTWIINKTHEHWKQYDPPSQNFYSFLVAIYISMLIFGSLGNSLVIWLFLRSRSLRNSANSFVLNLAVSDLLIVATNLPILIYNSVSGSVRIRGENYVGIGFLGCQVYGFMGGLCGTASIVTQAVIALDRYSVIVYPFSSVKRTSKKRTALKIFGLWQYSFVFASLPLFGIPNIYVPEGILATCSFDYLSQDIGNRVYILCFFVGAWVLPLSLITFSYLNIYRAVAESENSQFIQEAVKDSRASSKAKEMIRCRRLGKTFNSEKLEVRIAKTSLLAVSLWIIAWTPYAIMALSGVFLGPNPYLTPMVSFITSLVCKTVSCINPFVYALRHPKFRKEFFAIFLSANKLGNPVGYGCSNYSYLLCNVKNRKRSVEPTVDSVAVCVTSNLLMIHTPGTSTGRRESDKTTNEKRNFNSCIAKDI